tara:strand:+ start:42 stop:410 length:369 start_codon:yes stop_codon:yes gene_type:complete
MKRAITDMTLNYPKLYNLYYSKNNNIFKNFEIIFINKNKIEYDASIFFKNNNKIIELWIKNKKGYYNFQELFVDQFCWSFIKSNNIDYPIVLFWKKPIVIGENSIGFIFKSLLDVNKFMKNL